MNSVIASMQGSTPSKELPENVKDYQVILNESNNTSGRYAFILIFLGVFFFISGMTLAYLPEEWATTTNIMKFFVHGESTIMKNG